MAAQYEIQVKNGNRWSLHSYKENETSAVQEAKKILQQRIADQVQVSIEGNIIFDETPNTQKKKVGLGNITNIPNFADVKDLYEPDNIVALGRLLRDFCAQNLYNITELFHHYKSLERFIDDPICISARDRIATLLCGRMGHSEIECRENLFQLILQAKDRCRSSGYDDIKKGGLNDYIISLGDITESDTRFRLMLSITQVTMNTNSWEGKIALLFDLLGDPKLEELHENTQAFLDEFICHYFMLQDAILEMLGQQHDRNNALTILVKLCTAQYEPKKWDTPMLEKISRIMTKLPMSRCRQTLANRIEQMLTSRSPLTKGDMYEEKHAFKELLPMFIAKNGSILGGEGMAEALTICGTRSFNRDRTLENPAEAIGYIMDTLDVPIYQLGFLLTLGKSQFGQDCKGIIADFLPKFMNGPEHIHDIVHYKLPLKRKLKIISGFQKSALKIDLPQKKNIAFVEWLDELLFNYLNEERIIDKMDSPDESLFKRATSLLQFCASGLLVEGKTLAWVRERVQEHLRQPNFVEKFTEDVQSTKKKEVIITQLHAMLKKAGLQQ